MLYIPTITHHMMMKRMTKLIRVAVEETRTMQNRLLSSSVGTCTCVSMYVETTSSCPLTLIVGLTSLARTASNNSISTVAVTVPSSEAWARVEEKVIVPLEQEVVEL